MAGIAKSSSDPSPKRADTSTPPSPLRRRINAFTLSTNPEFRVPIEEARRSSTGSAPSIPFVHSPVPTIAHRLIRGLSNIFRPSPLSHQSALPINEILKLSLAESTPLLSQLIYVKRAKEVVVQISHWRDCTTELFFHPQLAREIHQMALSELTKHKLTQDLLQFEATLIKAEENTSFLAEITKFKQLVEAARLQSLSEDSEIPLFDIKKKVEEIERRFFPSQMVKSLEEGAEEINISQNNKESVLAKIRLLHTLDLNEMTRIFEPAVHEVMAMLQGSPIETSLKRKLSNFFQRP